MLEEARHRNGAQEQGGQRWPEQAWGSGQEPSTGRGTGHTWSAAKVSSLGRRACRAPRIAVQPRQALPAHTPWGSGLQLAWPSPECLAHSPVSHLPPQPQSRTTHPTPPPDTPVGPATTPNILCLGPREERREGGTAGTGGRPQTTSVPTIPGPSLAVCLRTQGPEPCFPHCRWR